MSVSTSVPSRHVDTYPTYTAHEIRQLDAQADQRRQFGRWRIHGRVIALGTLREHVIDLAHVRTPSALARTLIGLLHDPEITSADLGDLLRAIDRTVGMASLAYP